MIDLSSVSKFGTMTKGFGLAGIFDGVPSTSGWAEQVSGYAGVDLSTGAKRIDRAQVTSQANGFDGSGMLSSISLQIRAKNGSPPTSATDGSLLGQRSFTDINAKTTVEIESTDKQTAWDYVWIAITTGVWAVIADIKLFEAQEAVPPIAGSSILTVYQKACNTSFPLPQKPVEVPGFTFDIAVDEAGVALADIQVNVIHAGNLFTPQYLNALGIGVELMFKFATDYAQISAAEWQLPPNSRTNGINVEEPNPAHYTNVGIPTSLPVQPGFYRFGLSMSAHTDGDIRDGLARVLVERGKGLNSLRVTVIKGGEFKDMSK